MVAVPNAIDALVCRRRRPLFPLLFEGLSSLAFRVELASIVAHVCRAERDAAETDATSRLFFHSGRGHAEAVDQAGVRGVRRRAAAVREALQGSPGGGGQRRAPVAVRGAVRVRVRAERPARARRPAGVASPAAGSARSGAPLQGRPAERGPARPAPVRPGAPAGGPGSGGTRAGAEQSRDRAEQHRHGRLGFDALAKWR